MTGTLQERVDAARDAAADWLVRLARPTAGEADWMAFDAWLEDSPLNRQAYDQAAALWSELTTAAPMLNAAAAAARARPVGRPTRRTLSWAVGGALAAALVAALLPWGDLTARTVVYQTAKGERRSVTLADGTRIDLNAGSRLTVRLGQTRRRVTMGDAEAVFDVAKDARRPFLIDMGDRTIRVVGTRFNVRHRDGVQSVTVSRGLVEVAPSARAPGRTYRLQVGQRLDHLEGQAASTLRTAEPGATMSWRSGRLIYRDEPLSTVVSDLNRYTARPVRVADARTAGLRFSGVLVTADGEAMVRSLTLLAPVASTSTRNGLVLSAR